MGAGPHVVDVVVSDVVVSDVVVSNVVVDVGSDEFVESDRLLRAWDRMFAICFLLEIPLRGFPFQMRSFGKIRFVLFLVIRYFSKDFL